MTELIIPEKKLPAVRNDGAELVHRKMDVIATMLPSNVEPTAFFANAIMSANELGSNVNQQSIVTSVMNAASMGLMLGATLGHAYLIPYKGRCQCIPGYRGYLDLAFTNRFLRSVSAEVVLQGEECEIWHDETGRRIRHSLPLDRDLQRKNVVAAYCTYTTSAGGSEVVVVTRKELDKIDTGKNVWKSEYVAMAMKTAVRRAAKLWKITPALALAVQLDEYADRGELQPVPAGIEPIDEKPPVTADDFPHPLVEKMLNAISDLNSDEDVREFWQEFEPPFQAEGLTDAEKEQVRTALAEREASWS